jgi:large subunit ribosomal protein L4
MQKDVLNIHGAAEGSIDIDDTVWGIEPHISVMHQAVVRQQANARLGTHDTKTRSEVRGGGRKPWRQKGTGRARQGTIRAPQWKGGGVVFGPHPRKYTQQMPRQMRRLAIRSALSAKLQDERVMFVSGLEAVEPKTKAMKDVLSAFPPSRSVLVVMHEKVESIERAAANLDHVKTIVAGMISVRDVLKYERVLVTPEAVEVIEDNWALQGTKREPSQWKLRRQTAASATEEEVA